MTQEKTAPPKDRIASSFKQLASVSKDLNLAANELNKSISTLDEALDQLNLGVSAWHTIAGDEDEQDGSFWSRDIGYARIRSKWRIAIRKTWGNNLKDYYDSEEWAFADAPRWMGIEAIGKLPDLVDDLIKRTQETTGKIKARTDEAKELVDADSAAIGGLKPKG